MRVAGSTKRPPRAPSPVKKRGELRTSRSALRVMPVAVDVEARARRVRSLVERTCTVLPVLVVACADVSTPPPSRGSGTERVASRAAGSRAAAASVTAAPAAASKRARTRRGRVAVGTASTCATAGRRVAARGTAVGNCLARASAGSRNSGATSTASGLIGSVGSSDGSVDLGLATIRHCACAR